LVKKDESLKKIGKNIKKDVIKKDYYGLIPYEYIGRTDAATGTLLLHEVKSGARKVL
jgi:hypothetical protein